MVSDNIVTAAVVIAAIPIGYLVYTTLLSVNANETVAFGVAFVVMIGIAMGLPRLLSDHV